MTVVLAAAWCAAVLAGGCAAGPGAPASDAPKTTVDATDVHATLRRLASSPEFSGGNTEAEIDAAVAAFNDAGLDFSAAGIRSNLSTDCSDIDTEAVGAILGTELALDPEPYPFSTPGYPGCSLLSKRDPDVQMLGVFLSPDLNGTDNWTDIGTFDGAFPIAAVGDSALWSDGSRSVDNQTNRMMLQLFVTDGGTQSLIQANTSEPQLRHITSWTVPRLLLALAEIDAAMTE